jgi:hypothetical protein
MKKFLFVMILILSFVFIVSSQKLNISSSDIDEIIDSIKAGNSINTKINYLWSGTITKIDKKENNDLEVTVTKAKWVDKNTLNTYKTLLKVSDQENIDKIMRIGINKKIIFIAEIISIKDDIIPVCNPLIIKAN